MTPIVLFLAFRWALLEPFVIPSESMVPNLFIHDHILVKKFSYGLKSLFAESWLFKWDEPRRGDIIVFKYPKNKDLYFIKRVVGIPGDIIKVKGLNLFINSKLIELEPQLDYNESISSLLKSQPEAHYYKEFIQPDSSIDSYRPLGVEPLRSYFVRYEEGADLSEAEETFEVPENEYFVLGDNRNNSQDSRYWGFVPFNLVVGQAWRIWFSCEKMLESAPLICDPTSLRKTRFFKRIL